MLVLVGVSLVLSACNPVEDRARLDGQSPVETVATAEVTASLADQSTPYIATPDEALVPIGSAKCAIGYVVLPHGGRLVPDPAIFAIDGSFLYSEVYSGLTRLDPITGDVETELADSYASSNDGRSYTFRLREGLRFSDGSPVEPSDIAFSWARALSPELRSPWSEFVLGNVVGAHQVIAGSARELSGFTIVDSSTIEVQLTAPDVGFPAKLAHRVAAILKESNVAKWPPHWTDPWSEVIFDGTWEFVDLPVGTGPLKFAEFDYWSNSAVLVPNDHYWAGTVGATGVILRDQFQSEKSLIILDEETNVGQAAEYVGIDDSAKPRFQEFDIVEVDAGTGWPNQFANSNGADSTVNYDWRGYNPVSSVRLPEESFLAFNSAVAPFDDVQFRLALVASAQTDSLVYRDFAPVPRERATGILPPDVRSTHLDPYPTPNRERAIEYMEQSKYANKLANQQIELHSLGAFMPFDYETVSENWRDWFDVDVGFDRSEEIDDGYLLFTVGPETVQRYNRLLNSGELQVRFVEVQPTRNSPEEILGLFRNLFGPKADSPEVQELNALLDAAQAEADQVKRARLYDDIEQHILDRGLAIPIAWGSATKYELVREWISGYEPSQYLSSVFKDVTVDTSHPDYPSDRPCR